MHKNALIICYYYALPVIKDSYKWLTKYSTVHRKEIDCGINTIYSLHVKDIQKKCHTVIMEMRYLLFVDHVINRRTGKTCHKGARSGGGGTGASREAT